MTPLLIVLAYWEGDRAQATEICKIAAGLQPGHVGPTAHFLLVPRQDCSFDQNMINILAPKFNVFTHQSTSPLKGWPAGANGMFGSSMIHVATNFENKYEAVYWLEPDCVPIVPNWFWDLVLEWRRRHPTTNIVGCRHDCHGDGTGDHISGCALYHPNIARILPEITRCDNWAWDYQHRAAIVRMGGPTKLIQNRYKQTNVDPGVIEEPGVVLIHGVKSPCVMNAVKKKYRIA